MAKIMLVDDAAFMRMMVKNALTKAGMIISWRHRTVQKL